MTYSYQHGGASLMDMLNAQSDYRTVQLAYLQLIGSYLTAAGQLNLAVGREVIPMSPQSFSAIPIENAASLWPAGMRWLPLILSGCKSKEEGSGAPPPAQVIQVPDMNLLTIDENDVAKFPLVTAEKVDAASELNATGSVFPDVSREVPVISLANGRVVDIKTRLDDNVKKGQLLFQVQSPDITNAFNAYLKAVNDEQLANKADLRAQDLFKHGAISQAMVEQADDRRKRCQGRSRPPPKNS